MTTALKPEAGRLPVFLKQNGFVVAETESTKDSGCNARFARARATAKSAGASGVELGLKQF